MYIMDTYTFFFDNNNIENIDKHIYYMAPHHEQLNEDKIKRILDSFRDEVKLKITYESSNGDITERFIEPMKLLCYGGTWYLVSYCFLKNDVRIFRLGLIQSIKLTRDKFEKKFSVAVINN